MDELKKLRNDLDMCDEILIDALRMRCQIIQEITNYKQKKRDFRFYQAEEEERKKSKMLAKLDDYEYQKVNHGSLRQRPLPEQTDSVP